MGGIAKQSPKNGEFFIENVGLSYFRHGLVRYIRKGDPVRGRKG